MNCSTHEVAKHLAEEQYARFRIEQDSRFESGFEKEAKRLAGGKRGTRKDPAAEP